MCCPSCHAGRWTGRGSDSRLDRLFSRGNPSKPPPRNRIVSPVPHQIAAPFPAAHCRRGRSYKRVHYSCWRTRGAPSRSCGHPIKAVACSIFELYLALCKIVLLISPPRNEKQHADEDENDD